MISTLDQVIIGIYLTGTVAVGILCKGRQSNTKDYFLAGGRMGSFFQSLLVGLSLAATMFSGISLLAFPSVVYSEGIGMMLGILTLPGMYFILRYWFLPPYLHADLSHPYEIIERKLGPQMRTVAAGMFMLLRLGWMAALIYAPTVAILAVAGLPDSWFWPLILVVGLSSTLYTTIGGIRGVIVTDAIQFVVIAMAIVLTLGLILFRIPASLGQIFSFLSEKELLHMVDVSPDPRKVFTVWSVCIGWTISRCGQYMADQMSLQRYLASKDVRSASRSFLINVLGAMGITGFLVFIGLAVRAWYHFAPDGNLPKDVDMIFPYFVATQLPTGISGLFLAAILAATVSSMSSGINALAATVTLDFRNRIWRRSSPRGDLWFARVISAVTGTAATIAAGFVGNLGSIFDITQSVLGVFLGPLFGCMYFAIGNRRIRKGALFVGLATGFGVGVWITFSVVASIWVAAAACFTTIGVTYAGSIRMPNHHPIDMRKELPCEKVS